MTTIERSNIHLFSTIAFGLLMACSAGPDGSETNGTQLQQMQLDEIDLFERRDTIARATADRSQCEPVSGTAQPLVPARQGCSMAHCDNRMSDNINLDPPQGRPAKVAHDTSAAGAFLGEGCASNGRVAACLLATSRDALVVYDAGGRRLGSSGDHLNFWSWASGPIVGEDDSIIGVDSVHLIRFRPNPATHDLEVVWKVCHPGGVPISPVLTDDGLIVIGSKLGPMSVYDSRNGERLAELTISDASGTYDTMNTVSVRGRRYYISTEERSDTAKGRLYAVDLVSGSDGTFRLTPAWHVDFHGPSGASPLRIADRIYFDGTSAQGRGVAYGVRDLGDRAELLWDFSLPVDTNIPCSLAQDPRGGVWVLATMWSVLYRLDEHTGQVIDELDVDRVLDAPRLARYFPGSQMTLAGDSSHPVLLISAVAGRGDPARPAVETPTYTLAIDLRDNSRLWRVRLGGSWVTGPFTLGMHPIMRSGGRSVIAAAGLHSGVYFIE